MSRKEKGCVPKLRFPGFWGAWELSRLSKIGENLDNKRVPITESDRVRGKIPYYGASGIIDYVKDFIFDEDILCISEDGANLVDRTYPIAFSVTGKSWVNNHAHLMRFAAQSTQFIIEKYLNSIRLDDFLTGAAQPKLNRAMLDSIPIPLPTLPEQKKSPPASPPSTTSSPRNPKKSTLSSPIKKDSCSNCFRLLVRPRALRGIIPTTPPFQGTPPEEGCSAQRKIYR